MTSRSSRQLENESKVFFMVLIATCDALVRLGVCVTEHIPEYRDVQCEIPLFEHVPV
jgi:hypothetical protein